MSGCLLALYLAMITSNYIEFTHIVTYVNKTLLGDVKPVKDFLSNVKSVFVHRTNESLDEFFVLEL